MFTMLSSNNYGVTLETLLIRLYSLIEYDSAVYLDEIGYKWYELNNVLRILNISEDEYINGIYLMEIDDKSFISEEGINMLLLEYDNEYQEDLKVILTSEVMPDIKSDSMYLSDAVINSMQSIMCKYQAFSNDRTVDELRTVGKVNQNINKKKKRRNLSRRNKK